jgi:hypothetical protein
LFARADAGQHALDRTTVVGHAAINRVGDFVEVSR